MKSERLRVPANKKIKLADYDPGNTGPFRSKEEAAEKLAADIARLEELQDRLYAQSERGLLIVLQGIDAAGKDGTVKHVMSGVNPSGCQVTSFKVPSQEELAHDYLWRYVRALPRRGHIGIFNRSYYEEVLVVRVHPELLANEPLVAGKKSADIWSQRYREINHFERYLVDNGFVVLKFFLHLSKVEQKKRFLERLDAKGKNWKFSPNDVREREFWDEYAAAYEEMLSHTSSDDAPWYVIPADHKWFSRVAVADVIVSTLDGMDLGYPKLTPDQRKQLAQARKQLENEK